MTILTDTRRNTLTALVDAIHPEVDGMPAASGLGAVESLEVLLADVDWNGERFYAAAPHEDVPHPGHGWQGGGNPAALLGQALDLLAAPVRDRGAPAVVADAWVDRFDLGVIASSDLVRLIHRHVLVHVTGVVLR